jgi:hypothetical protein
MNEEVVLEQSLTAFWLRNPIVAPKLYNISRLDRRFGRSGRIDPSPDVIERQFADLGKRIVNSTIMLCGLMRLALITRRTLMPLMVESIVSVRPSLLQSRMSGRQV